MVTHSYYSTHPSINGELLPEPVYFISVRNASISSGRAAPSIALQAAPRSIELGESGFWLYPNWLEPFSKSPKARFTWAVPNLAEGVTVFGPVTGRIRNLDRAISVASAVQLREMWKVQHRRDVSNDKSLNKECYQSVLSLAPRGPTRRGCHFESRRA